MAVCYYCFHLPLLCLPHKKARNYVSRTWLRALGLFIIFEMLIVESSSHILNTCTRYRVRLHIMPQRRLLHIYWWIAYLPTNWPQRIPRYSLPYSWPIENIFPHFYLFCSAHTWSQKILPVGRNNTTMEYEWHKKQSMKEGRFLAFLSRCFSCFRWPRSR